MALFIYRNIAMAWFIYRNIAWSVSVASHAFGRQSLVWLKLLRCHGWRGNNIINIRFIIIGYGCRFNYVR